MKTDVFRFFRVQTETAKISVAANYAVRTVIAKRRGVCAAYLFPYLVGRILTISTGNG
jgi:hypothetical protein